MAREIIRTDLAPQAIGTYSQAVKVGSIVYLSGQIPLVPETMELVQGDMEAQIRRVFDNLQAVARAAGGSLADVFTAAAEALLAGTVPSRQLRGKAVIVALVAGPLAQTVALPGGVTGKPSPGTWTT